MERPIEVILYCFHDGYITNAELNICTRFGGTSGIICQKITDMLPEFLDWYSLISLEVKYMMSFCMIIAKTDKMIIKIEK